MSLNNMRAFLCLDYSILDILRPLRGKGGLVLFPGPAQSPVFMSAGAQCPPGVPIHLPPGPFCAPLLFPAVSHVPLSWLMPSFLYSLFSSSFQRKERCIGGVFEIETSENLSIHIN